MIHIIGAGPAGLITGLFLIKKGYEIKILEKNERIKSTPCGEGCDEASLNKIPFNYTAYISRKVKGIKMCFKNKHFYANINGIVLNRQKWMEGMANEIIERGGKIEFSSKVSKIDDDYIYLNGRKERYDICIGADGPLSVVKEYFGNKYEYMVGCQYEIEYDTTNIDFLEFYLDRDFSNYYAWIFPKEKSINVGLIGKFSMLDKFVEWKKLKGKILKKEAGLIPIGKVKKIASKKIALIGDAACITNPFSLGGLSPIIYASKILADNINNLEEYGNKLMKHPILSPILLKGMLAARKMNNKEIELTFKNLNGKDFKEIKTKDFLHLLIRPSILIKMYYVGKAFLHSLNWGW